MSTNRITSLAAMVISVFYLYLITFIETPTFSDPVGPRAFPMLIGGGMLFCGILLFLYDAVVVKETPIRFSFLRSGNSGPFWKTPLAATTAICIVYTLTFEPLGYLIATTLFVWLIMTYLNKSKWIVNIVFSTSFSIGSYIVFVRLLNLVFPLGLLEGII